MPARSQYDATSVPLPRNLIYLTKDGYRLCARDADRHVQHMVRARVNGYCPSFEGEVCDKCGSILSTPA